MTDYSDREIALEASMAELGQDRRKALTARTRQSGKESMTGAGRVLVKAAMGRVVEYVDAWMAEQKTRRPANRGQVYELVLAVPIKVAALLAVRTMLDGGSKGATYQATIHEVARRLDEERMGRWLARTHASTWNGIRRRAASVPERMFMRLRKSARAAAREKGWTPWSVKERLILGAFWADAVVQAAGLIQLDTWKQGRRKRVEVRIREEVVEWIATADQKDALLEPLYMPMVDVPKDWGPGMAGGYTTGLVARRWIVKNRSKKTRELVAAAEMPAVYAAVNGLQQTPWSVNTDVLEVAQALFDTGHEAPGLATSEPTPMPPRVEPITVAAMRQRFLVRRANLQRTSVRLGAARLLWLGQKYREGSFYYPQQLDFRGRVYPVPQFLQPQGPDLARGVLRFAAGSWIERDEPSSAWFWIHGANCYGLDKAPLDARAFMIRQHEPAIRAVYQDPIEHRWWMEADEPWQFLAWCLEAGQLLEQGRVRTHVPCYIDGTNNGLQILSLLLRDPVGGAATNCQAHETRRDIYQDVADDVTRRLRQADDETARGWLAWFPDGRLPRAAAKRPVMCVPYGCTRWSSRQYLADWFDEELRQGRTSPWGNESAWPRLTVLAGHLWAAIEALLGRALECMAWLRDCARISVEAGVAPVWTSPTGMPTRQAYTNAETLQIRAKFGERVRWVQHRVEGDKLNRRRHVNALPPNFVHSLDAAALAMAVDRFRRQNPGAPISTIHDSFGTTAPFVPALGAAVREVYAELFSQPLLEIFREQLVANCGGRVQFPQPPAGGTLDPREVIGSAYMFS